MKDFQWNYGNKPRRICKNCQYWRDKNTTLGARCYNSKSPLYFYAQDDNFIIPEYFSCKVYIPITNAAGIKLPLWLRLLNRIMGWLK